MIKLRAISKSNKGFTLQDLIVAISAITLFTGVIASIYLNVYKMQVETKADAMATVYAVQAVEYIDKIGYDEITAQTAASVASTIKEKFVVSKGYQVALEVIPYNQEQDLVKVVKMSLKYTFSGQEKVLQIQRLKVKELERRQCMKNQKGVTLTALVIYIAVATIVIGIMSVVGSYFFSNIDAIKQEEKYVVEFNKFNMFFINDIKEFKTAEVEANKVTLADGTIIYQYKEDEKAIYRNELKIAEQIQSVTFTPSSYTVAGTNKNLIQVSIIIGNNNQFNKTIEYVLKYW